jgi:hypothetical protein
MGAHSVVYTVMTPTMAACGGLLGLVCIQIHPDFCGSGQVLGPVIRHLSCFLSSVPIGLMGTQILVCDDPPTLAACGRLPGLVQSRPHSISGETVAAVASNVIIRLFI